MARRSTASYNRKAQKGMKSLGKMIDFTAKVGAAAYKSASKPNKSTYFGATSQNRTGDLQVTNLLLYQLSYYGINYYLL